MKSHPRIIQIAITGDGTQESAERIVALCDDGTLWVTSIVALTDATDAEWHSLSTPGGLAE